MQKKNIQRELDGIGAKRKLVTPQLMCQTLAGTLFKGLFMDKFLSPSFLQFFLPLIGGVVAWFANERKKRAWEEYEKKEEHYHELMRTIKGFYVSTNNPILKDEFIEQLKQCWLYCPDDVIIKGYEFLNTVHTGHNSSDSEKELALGELIISIRKDLLSRKITRRSKLTPNDYKHFYIVS